MLGGKGTRIMAVGEVSVPDANQGRWKTNYDDGYGVGAGLSLGDFLIFVHNLIIAM